MEQIRISAKTLGETALPDFCPRCFWIKLKCNNKLPFQIFPGIFSSMDSFQKKVTKSYFETHKRLPFWYEQFGELGELIKAPTFHSFKTLDEKTGVLLTGSPDEVLKKADGSYFIVDDKTAKFTGTQDELFPLYEVQLNAYAFIANRLALKPVSGIGLIYHEPITDVDSVSIGEIMNETGFQMYFRPKLLKVDLDEEKVAKSLETVRTMSDFRSPPDPRGGCEDCLRLGNIMAALH